MTVSDNKIRGVTAICNIRLVGSYEKERKKERTMFTLHSEKFNHILATLLQLP